MPFTGYGGRSAITRGIGEMMRRVDVIIQQKSGEVASSIITFPFHHFHRDSSKAHYLRDVERIAAI